MFHTPPQSRPISYCGESVILSFKQPRLNRAVGKYRGKREMWVIRWTCRKNWGRGNEAMGSVLQSHWLMGRRCGSSRESRVHLHSAETAPGAGLWHDRGTKGKACGPQPAFAFSHCSKLALEYGWGYFMIIYKSFSDDMNPLMRWSCDKIPCKAINFSADVFLEGGKKLFSRKVSCGWLNFKFIFCSSAERVEIKSLVLLTIAPILLY